MLVTKCFLLLIGLFFLLKGRSKVVILARTIRVRERAHQFIGDTWGIEACSKLFKDDILMFLT
jgi:hypothetical protein